MLNELSFRAFPAPTRLAAVNLRFATLERAALKKKEQPNFQTTSAAYFDWTFSDCAVPWLLRPYM